MTQAVFKVETLEDLQKLSQSELIAAISEGLPTMVLREFAARLGVTTEQMAGLLRLTPRTFQRRLEEPQLQFSESERLWELGRLFFRAIEVLGGESAAVNWFKSPIQALGWATALSLAQTSVGLRELENVLGRIEHGVFS